MTRPMDIPALAMVFPRRKALLLEESCKQTALLTQILDQLQSITAATEHSAKAVRKVARGGRHAIRTHGNGYDP